jgi:hypothetical protein
MEMRACACCMSLFKPQVSWQEFCNSKCRSLHNRLHGTAGRAVVVRRLIKNRTSVVLHFDGPAAEAALKFAVGDILTIAKAARQS